MPSTQVDRGTNEHAALHRALVWLTSHFRECCVRVCVRVCVCMCVCVCVDRVQQKPYELPTNSHHRSDSVVCMQFALCSSVASDVMAVNLSTSLVTDAYEPLVGSYLVGALFLDYSLYLYLYLHLTAV
jgi:hypothetical protein